MVYRDGLRLRQRWRQTCDDFHAAMGRLRQLPVWVRRRGPAGLRERLDAAPDPRWFDQSADPSTIEEVERAEERVAELCVALAEAEALAAKGEPSGPVLGRVIGERPLPPLDRSPPPPELDFAESAEELSRLLAPYGSAPKWVDYQSVFARFDWGDVSYSLTFARDGLHADRFRLATGVADVPIAFHLVPQTGLDDLLQMIDLQKKSKVGHEAFDITFRVVGDTRCLGLLVPQVRQELLLMARVDVPSLDVGGGAAVLRWGAPLDKALIEAALRALSALCAATAQLRPLFWPPKERTRRLRRGGRRLARRLKEGLEHYRAKDQHPVGSLIQRSVFVKKQALGRRLSLDRRRGPRGLRRRPQTIITPHPTANVPAGETPGEQNGGRAAPTLAGPAGRPWRERSLRWARFEAYGPVMSDTRS